ncbi:MAG TPA: hypothetical protein VEF71_10850 [Streptosporangiaceae bacterium]|nr:hypothetical protein [Streptosporangiaceae bacterium]
MVITAGTPVPAAGPPVPAPHESTGACARTPEPPDVATGTETHGWRAPAALPVPGWPATPRITAAGAAADGTLTLTRAKYPVVTAVAAISATAVQFDQRRTRRRPSARASPAWPGGGPPGPGSLLAAGRS